MYALRAHLLPRPRMRLLATAPALPQLSILSQWHSQYQCISRRAMGSRLAYASVPVISVSSCASAECRHKHTFSRSIGYMTECSYRLSSAASYPFCLPICLSFYTHSNARECAGGHVGRQREIGRQRLITANLLENRPSVSSTDVLVCRGREFGILVFIRLFQYQLVMRRHGLARSVDYRLHDCRRCRGRARHSKGRDDGIEASLLSDG